MTNLFIFLLFALGLLLTVKGGDLFVDSASWMAEVSGIPKFIVGATIVSVATTLPEMLVSIMAALKGSVDMGIGNAVGSVTVNTALIMGIAIVCIPFAINRKQYFIKTMILVAAAILLPLLSLSGELKTFGAVILLAVFVFYIIENIHSAKHNTSLEERPTASKNAIISNVAKFLIGAAGVVVGARLMVDNGSAIARLMGIPESVIGLTIIAIGTSLPELVTMIVAVKKHQVSLSVGNIIGANIIDLTSILPVCALISGGSLPVSQQSFMVDMPVCLLVIAVGLIPTVIRGKFSRVQGILTMIIYAVYLVFMVF